MWFIETNPLSHTVADILYVESLAKYIHSEIHLTSVLRFRGKIGDHSILNTAHIVDAEKKSFELLTATISPQALFLGCLDFLLKMP